MNNATRTAAQTIAAQTIAADIIARARKATGPMWSRLSPDGQLVEVRSILCCDMLRTMEPADHTLIIKIHHILITSILPE